VPILLGFTLHSNSTSKILDDCAATMTADKLLERNTVNLQEEKFLGKIHG
jgi:hypothetical protein